MPVVSHNQSNMHAQAIPAMPQGPPHQWYVAGSAWGASNNTKCKIDRKIKKVRRGGKGKHQHGMQSCNVYCVNINMDSSLK